MSGETVGFLSVGGMILVNIIISSYNYGRLTERVTSIERRVDNLEQGTSVCMGHGALESRLRDVEIESHVRHTSSL